ncbi:MAG: class F sortase [Chloroflexota bacterium]
MQYRALIMAVLSAGVVFSSASPSASAATSRARYFDPVPSGWPVLVTVPRIGVRAPIEALALNQKNDFHAPYKWGDVVWYNRGPRPGDLGRSDIFGHLDSLCCPAVFYKLRNLRKGDHVYVVYRSGQALEFQVWWQAVYSNAKMPYNWMFGRTSDRGIMLMTCTGAFHRDGTGYDHKLLVYATLVWPKHQ